MADTPWNNLIAELPEPHLLQTAQWAEVKGSFGWKPYFLTWQQTRGGVNFNHSQNSNQAIDQVSAAALVLVRKALPGLSVLYIPKGPLLSDWSDAGMRSRVFEDIQAFGKQLGVLQVKMDPDVPVGRGVPGEDSAVEVPVGIKLREQLVNDGWRYSSDQIQFRNTYLVDLTPDEDQLLSRMKSKTRYNIRLSGRKGIKIRLGDQSDLSVLYQMYARTSTRAGFTIRSEEYYQKIWRTFMDNDSRSTYDPAAQPIVAEYDGQPVAGAVLFRFGTRAWYLHGMSVADHSEKMPTYLVQWEAMRWAKSAGCHVYDMWGAPDQFDQSDSLWGVYRFKRGFGGEVLRTIGAWDYPLNPLLYWMYARLVPVLLSGMRLIGDRQTATIAEKDLK